MDRTDRQIDGEFFLDKNGLYNPIAQKIADTYFNGELGYIDVKLDFDDFISCIQAISYGHTDVIGEELFKDLLTGELDWFGYYDEVSLNDWFRLSDISDENIMQLQKLNKEIPVVLNSDKELDSISDFLDKYFDEDECEFRDDLEYAFLVAVREGNTIGAETECYKDFQNSLEACFKENYDIDRDRQEFSFLGSAGSIISQSMRGEVGGYDLSDKDELGKAICTCLLEENFRFYEPQYGWNDFSEDAFNDRLSDELYSIVADHTDN